jgi:hypothetical protein
MVNKQSTREAVISALRKSSDALDAYQVAKHTGLTPIQAGRTLLKLASEQMVMSDDDLADSANTLSAQFRLLQ